MSLHRYHCLEHEFSLAQIFHAQRKLIPVLINCNCRLYAGKKFSHDIYISFVETLKLSGNRI